MRRVVERKVRRLRADREREIDEQVEDQRARGGPARFGREPVAQAPVQRHVGAEQSEDPARRADCLLPIVVPERGRGDAGSAACDGGRGEEAQRHRGTEQRLDGPHQDPQGVGVEQQVQRAAVQECVAPQAPPVSVADRRGRERPEAEQGHRVGVEPAAQPDLGQEHDPEQGEQSHRGRRRRAPVRLGGSDLRRSDLRRRGFAGLRQPAERIQVAHRGSP